MATLLIDIGNTALKAAWADGITLGKTFRYQGERMVDFIISLTRDSRPELIVLSSVRNFSAQNVDRIILLNRGSIYMDTTPGEIFTNSDLLEKCGLRVPEVTRIIKLLNDGGMKLPENIFTVEDAKNAICSALGVAK